MDLELLKKIMKEFEKSKIHKLEISEKEFTVKLEKKDHESITPVSNEYILPDTSRTNDKETIETENLFLVKSPLVGTFYDSPSPDSDAFIVLNQKVNKGDILFIVEAMKVMNEVTSPVSGTVKNIKAENATMVEFGQVVIEIEE